MIGNIIEWLTQDATSPKHSTTWKHPVAAWLIHLVVSSLILVTFHDVVITRQHPQLGTFSLCDEYPDWQTTKSKWVACFCFFYAIVLLVIRLVTNPPGIRRYAVLYEMTWLCNSSLLFGGPFGLSTCRPHIATGFAIAVSIDQILVYVDILGYVCNRLMGAKKKKMFPIGVCQYLVWPETHWSAKITFTHHLWTIPLLIYGANGIQWEAYYMNSMTVASYVLLSRWLTPFGLNSKNAKNEDSEKTPRFEKYMNVNLSHELWQDIRIGILRRQADNQTTMVYLVRLIIWWQMFNLCCFLFLRGIF